MVSVRAADAVPHALVALSFTVKVPCTTGVPEIAPVAESSSSPAGRPDAAKLEGKSPAVIW